MFIYIKILAFLRGFLLVVNIIIPKIKKEGLFCLLFYTLNITVK
nr:MAG TPA: hypothetical protein [Caudoviricetes sp.]